MSDPQNAEGLALFAIALGVVGLFLLSGGRGDPAARAARREAARNGTRKALGWLAITISLGLLVHASRGR